MSSDAAGSSESFREKAVRALRRPLHEPYTGAVERPRRQGPPSDGPGYSGKRAADIVGISYRQIDYWARTDVIVPSIGSPDDGGFGRRYSYRDLIELRLVKTLLDNGMKLESIREAFLSLRDEMGDDIASAKLVIAANSAVLVADDEALIDVLDRCKGEGLLNVLSLDGVKEQVDAAIAGLGQRS